jgi:hypothetical protein
MNNMNFNRLKFYFIRVLFVSIPAAIAGDVIGSVYEFNNVLRYRQQPCPFGQGC